MEEQDQQDQVDQAQEGDLQDDDASYQPVGGRSPQPAPSAEPLSTDPMPARVALITGGAGAVATAVAMELARRGWSIFLQHSPGQGGIEDAVKAIRNAASGRPAEVLTAAADLTAGAGREQLVEQALEAFDRIDMLVNADIAPAGGGSDLLVLTEDDFRSAVNSTLTATMFLTQQVANEMVRLVEAGLTENPRIVTISTLNAYITSIDSAGQCVSQAALGMMTRLFADRLGEYGINVYEVRTGILASGAGDQSYAKYDALIAQGLTPIRRWGRPGDAARAVAAIAEDLLGFSTGEVINVDGGFHIQRL